MRSANEVHAAADTDSGARAWDQTDSKWTQSRPRPWCSEDLTGSLHHGRGNSQHLSQLSMAIVTLRNKPPRTQRLQTHISSAQERRWVSDSGLGEAPSHDLGLAGLWLGARLPVSLSSFQQAGRSCSRGNSTDARAERAPCKHSASVRTWAKLRTRGWGDSHHLSIGDFNKSHPQAANSPRG